MKRWREQLKIKMATRGGQSSVRATLVERRAARRAELIVVPAVVLIIALIWAAAVMMPSKVVLATTSAGQRLERSVARPQASVATSPGSVGWLGSPATGLGAGGFSFGLRAATGGRSRDNNRGAGWALFGGVPLGPAQLGWAAEHLVDPAPAMAALATLASPALVPNRFTLALATRFDDWIDVGVAARWSRDVPATMAPLMTVDLGLRATPWSWLSLGVYISDLLGNSLYRYPAGGVHGSAIRPENRAASADPAWGAVVVGPQLRAGVAMKLLADRLRLRMGMRWPYGGGTDVVRGSASWQISRGQRIGVAGRWSQVTTAATQPEQDSRISVFVALFSGDVRDGQVATDVAVGSDNAGGRAWPVSAGLAWHYAPPRGPWATVARRIRPRRITTASPALIDIARRQQRGWRAPLLGGEQADAAAVARSYLSISRAFATENRAALCGVLAVEVVLDIRSIDPALQLSARLTKRVACAQLRDAASPWSRYVAALGPAPVHAEASRYVGGLFAMHGSPYEWIPPKQEDAYQRAMARRNKPLQCRIWRVLPVRTLPKLRRIVDIVVLCDGQRDFVMQLEGSTSGGYRLRKLLVER